MSKLAEISSRALAAAHKRVARESSESSRRERREKATAEKVERRERKNKEKAQQQVEELKQALQSLLNEVRESGHKVQIKKTSEIGKLPGLTERPMFGIRQDDEGRTVGYEKVISLKIAITSEGDKGTGEVLELNFIPVEAHNPYAVDKHDVRTIQSIREGQRKFQSIEECVKYFEQRLFEYLERYFVANVTRTLPQALERYAVEEPIEKPEIHELLPDLMKVM